jgi:putative tryptophan/tyrosine transport system substrate-binding protein
MPEMVPRRAFVRLLGGAALWPAVSGAQARLPVVGYLSSRAASTEAPLREPFLRALGEVGFVIGRNVRIQYRHSNGREDQLLELASELVQRQVAILVTTDRASAMAAKAATSTIPIVFSVGEDPVRLGLVASLSKPGGNATGVYVFTTRLGAKRLGLIRQLLTEPGPVALLINPNSASASLQIEEMQQAASAIDQSLIVLRAGSEREVDAAFAEMAQQKVRAMLLSATPYYQVINDQLVELAARHRIPVFYEWREAVVAGGLMSYNTNRSEVGREIGRYVAQILKGTKPVDLPTVQSSSFQFVINLKTARALGLEIPPTLLAQADEVVE